MGVRLCLIMSDNFEEEGLSEAPAVLSAAPSQSDDVIVHHEPRISANKLAEYVIADPSRQKTILKDAKFARKVVVLPYKRTRACVADAFADIRYSG